MIAKKAKAREAYLIDALVAAEKAAIAADPGEGKDGGSCNMDFLVLKLKGIKEATMQRIAAKAGVRVDRCSWRPGAFQVCVTINGQAARRTCAVEAANRVLKEFGFNSHVHYLMD